MYQPPHFRETRADVLHALIRAHPLGLLINCGDDGPLANPLPFLLDTTQPDKVVLEAHLAKANPAWRAIAERPEMPVLAVFRARRPMSRPPGYETKKQTGKVVPTWNYAMVQARGKATVIDDPIWLRRQIGQLTDIEEASRAERWKVEDAPDTFVGAQIKGIIGLSIVVTELSGKWKVSQNRPVEDRLGVAKGYEADGDHAMESLVRAYGDLADD